MFDTLVACDFANVIETFFEVEDYRTDMLLHTKMWHLYWFYYGV